MSKTNFSDPRVSSRKFWQDFFDLFRLRKTRIHWGTVYDSQTKQPIDPAVVELLDFLTGEVRQTAITDLWGKYGFIAEPGDYLIRVRRGNYNFPSQKIKGTKDGIYGNVYHGEQIPVRGEWNLITMNIPLDPVGEDFNQQAKEQFAKIHPQGEHVLQWIINSFYWGGFVVSAIFYYRETGFVETLVLASFVLLFALRFLLPPRPLWGRIFSAKTGEPLGFVDMELLMPGGSDIIIGKTRSAPGGKYFLKTREGKFTLRITDPFSKDVLAEGPVSIRGEGILTSDIYV